ncbi:hypothetical protein BD560DRAFT_401515 [Blakeslea trispora]|nr:hypothetical protein BD560DRAFT_401515 [Blakeslea trispora]
MSIVKIIVSTDKTQAPVEFQLLFEKLNWATLDQLIQLSAFATSPLVLYYRYETDIKSMENQTQLTQLLNDLDSVSLLRLYAYQDEHMLPVSIPSRTALFARLGALVEENRSVIKSDECLIRWISVYASSIARHSDRDFDYEFQVLQKLFQSRRSHDSFGKNTAPMDGERLPTASNDSLPEQEQDLLELLESLDLSGCRREHHHHRHGPFAAFDSGTFDMFGHNKQFPALHKHDSSRGPANPHGLPNFGGPSGPFKFPPFGPTPMSHDRLNPLFESGPFHAFGYGGIHHHYDLGSAGPNERIKRSKYHRHRHPYMSSSEDSEEAHEHFHGDKKTHRRHCHRQ